jgi:SAM-dependent methyltransferase
MSDKNRTRKDFDTFLLDESKHWSVMDGILISDNSLPLMNSQHTKMLSDFYSYKPFPSYSVGENKGSLIKKSQSRIFTEILNKRISPKALILEVGCGTGQLGNYLAISGRQVLSVDATLHSLMLAEKFRKEIQNNSLFVAHMDLFNLPLKEKFFDWVICTGVLHHTNDPKRGFSEIAKLVKLDGYIVVGLYNKYGRFKTRLRQKLFKVNKKWALSLDPYLRNFDLDEDQKLSWVHDQYENPHESMHTIDEVFNWFEDSGFQYVSSFPNFLTDQYSRETTFDWEIESRGTYAQRLLAQIRQGLHEVDGGLYVVIGKKIEK